jgi:hypothetical protein
MFSHNSAPHCLLCLDGDVVGQPPVRPVVSSSQGIIGCTMRRSSTKSCSRSRQVSMPLVVRFHGCVRMSPELPVFSATLQVLFNAFTFGNVLRRCTTRPSLGLHLIVHLPSRATPHPRLPPRLLCCFESYDSRCPILNLRQWHKETVNFSLECCQVNVLRRRQGSAWRDASRARPAAADNITVKRI